MQGETEKKEGLLDTFAAISSPVRVFECRDCQDQFTKPKWRYNYDNEQSQPCCPCCNKFL